MFSEVVHHSETGSFSDFPRVIGAMSAAECRSRQAEHVKSSDVSLRLRVWTSVSQCGAKLVTA